MTKNQQLYHCTNCGSQFPKWTGQCQECEKWGTIEEENNSPSTDTDSGKNSTKNYPSAKTKTLDKIEKAETERFETKISELDRVLGGGFVPGSMILLGGEPGIGKSTISIQLADLLDNTLYFSGEESLSQIKIRADRLDVESEDMQLSNETNANIIASTIAKEKPKIAVIDSIQTLEADDVGGKKGNTKQIQACTTKILKAAKKSNTAVVIIGHVTKEGGVAGPKTLEHMVDTVLYFEGDKNRKMRMLRSVKNRFGATDEIGVFEMTQTGLKEIKNPSSALLEERGENMPGSIVTSLMEGTRPVLVEIQALTNKSIYGNPARKASGFDLNRLHVLAAVLQKRAKLNLAEFDIHINVVGGLKAEEPAADLSVCFAIASAYNDKPLNKNLAVFGEVGLGGEVRSVSNLEKRIKECSKLGIEKIITKLPDNNISIPDSIKVVSVKNIKELVSKTS